MIRKTRFRASFLLRSIFIKNMIFQLVDKFMLQNCCAAICASYAPFSLREKVVAEQPDEGLTPAEFAQNDKHQNLTRPASRATLSFKEREVRVLF